MEIYQPKISIIIPVYNVSKHLVKCLDSVLGQTLKDIEIVIINDCSPDDKDDLVCSSYASKDRRIVYIKNEVNSGVSFSRNCGLKIAKGEYISFIDSDDYLLDDKAYETCYNKLKEGNYDFLCFKVVEVNQYGKVSKAPWFDKEIYSHVKDKMHYSNNGFIDKANFYTIGGNFLSSYCYDKIYNKKFLLNNKIEFPLGLKLGEDRLFCLSVYHKAKNIYTMNNKYYAYLYNVGSASKSIDKEFIDAHLSMASNEYQYLYSNNLFDTFKERFLTISLISTLRNIANKIKRFTATKADEFELLNYYTEKLKNSILIDLLFSDCNTLLNVFRHKECKESDTKKLLNALISIAKKSLNLKWYVNKFLRLKGRFYLQIIRFYGKCTNLEHKNILLISERDDEAKDNGYALFRYLRENYPSLNVYYFIKFNKKNKDYLKVKNLGNILNVGSFKALAYYVYAKYYFSTHTELYNSIFRKYIGKNSYKNNLKYFMDTIKKNKVFVFLQHGIILNTLPKNYFHNICQFNFFISGAFKEYEFLKSLIQGGKYKIELIYTGLARYDYLDDLSNNKRQILLIPTWRRELVKEDSICKETFINSDYYKRYQSLINNKHLISLLEKNKYELVFCPHYQINLYYIDTFSTISKNITIANINDYDVSDLIKTSKLMITDYSSVFWDFAYLQKPVIYYQFDKFSFIETHLKEGYFSYEQNGFGDVLETEDSIVSKVEYYLKNNFKTEHKYIDKIKEHFTYNDKNNCKRILEAIGFDFNDYKKDSSL